MELDEDLGAVAVYRVADVLHAPYLPGVIDAELDAVAVAAVGVHGGELGDDEPAAALGAPRRNERIPAWRIRSSRPASRPWPS